MPVALISDLSAVPEAQRMLIRNNGGGHVNHSWFWNWMAPAGSGPKGPEGKLGAAIQSTFTSIDDFKKLFGEAGTKRFGSGWAWLIVGKDGKLKVTSTPNQDNPLMKGIVEEENLGTPILGTRRLGARLLPQVSKQTPRLHRRLVECGELGRSRQRLRHSQSLSHPPGRAHDRPDRGETHRVEAVLQLDGPVPLS
jgi:superoxide dismutase